MVKAAAMMGTVVVLAVVLSGCQSQSISRVDGLDKSAPQYMTEAHHYLKVGLTDSALASFGLALEVDGRITEAYLGMGNIYRKRGYYRIARQAYTRAVRDDPTNFDARYYLGLMDQMLGKLREAVDSYLAALSIMPNSHRANRDLAAAYLQLGRWHEAVPYAKKAARLNPQSQSAWANLGAAYSLVGEYARAVGAYRHAAELGKMPEQVLLGLANAHLELGHTQRAIITLTMLIHQYPSALAYERRGYAEFKQHDFEASLKDYRAAMRLDGKDPAALNGVGVCLMTLYIEGGREDRNEHDQALKLWRRSLELKPNQSHIIDLLSRYTNM